MRSAFTALFLIAFSACSWSQLIVFPLVKNVVNIDGIISNNEWQHADSIKIAIGNNDSVTVKFQHDSSAMFFAFTGKLESSNALFPEVLLDPAYVRGASWTSGQWWFHVSATDCENNGAYGVYNNCKVVQPDWEGVANFTSGPPNTDTVEIRIPFSKAGFSLANDTMGIVLMVTNTFNIFDLWPSAANRNNPSTWGKAVFRKFTTAISPIEEKALLIYPNPVENIVSISGLKAGASILLADLCGKIVLQEEASVADPKISLAHLPAGSYFLRISDESGYCRTYHIIRQ